MRALLVRMKYISTMINRQLLLREKAVSAFWEDNEYSVYWEGLVFVNGFLSGIESVKAFVSEARTKGIQDAVRILRGIFFISMKIKESGEIYAFVDNSGLYQAFYTENTISTSFLKLVERYQLKVHQMNPEAVIEFLSFGVMFFDKTYFPSISRIPRDMILKIVSDNAAILPLKKNILPLQKFEGNPSEYFRSEFSGFAASLSNLNVSVDFTGGTDTRLIALLLAHFGLKFETAVSGGTEAYEDVYRSKDVASALGYTWYGSIHTFESLEEDLPQLMYDTEGLYNILHYHRLYQLQQSRVRRGVDTIISGVGGDLFKDFWWLQDFPLYSKRASNIEKLLDMRIMSAVPRASFYTQRYSTKGKALRNHMMTELMKFRLDTNTMTYDNIFYNFRMREEAGRELTNYSPHVYTFAPLLDLDIVRAGFSLPRINRVASYFHRRELTRLNPSFARLPTTEGGISASSEVMMMAMDIPKYTTDKIKRLLIKLGLKKQHKFAELNHPGFFSHVRQMGAMNESLTALKDLGIIRPDTCLDDIGNGHLGMILTVGRFVQLLET